MGVAPGRGLAQRHLGAAQPGDGRRAERPVDVAGHVLRRPPGTLPQVRQLIGFYAARPTIEGCHRGAKTGPGTESLPPEHAERQRDAQTTAARSIVPVLFVRVLPGKPHGRPRDGLSVRGFLIGVARPGGPPARKHGGPPSPGLDTATRGATLVSCHPCHVGCRR